MALAKRRLWVVNQEHEDFSGRVEAVQTERETYVWTSERALSTLKNKLALFNAPESGYEVRLLSVLLQAASDYSTAANIRVQLDLVRITGYGFGSNWNPDYTGYGYYSVRKQPVPSGRPFPPGITGAMGGTWVTAGWLSTRWIGIDDDGFPLNTETEMLPQGGNRRGYRPAGFGALGVSAGVVPGVARGGFRSPGGFGGQGLILREGEGIGVRGAVANSYFSFVVTFTVEKKGGERR